MKAPMLILSGRVPTAVGAGLVQVIVVSLMMVAAEEGAPVKAHVRALAGVNAQDTPPSALEFSCMPSKPAPVMVRLLTQPMPVPQGITLS